MRKITKGILLFSIVGLILALSFHVKKSYDSYTIIKPKDSSIAIYVEGSDGYEMYNSELLPTSGYTFNASESSCANGATLSYNSSNFTLSIESISSNTQCNIYFDKVPVTLANYIIGNVPVVTSGAGLYHHTSDTTSADYVANSAEDDSYRYAGAGGYQSGSNTYNSSTDVVNNWLCFGESDGTSCSNEHQYRIIGIMNDGTIKIIKADSIGNQKFDDNSNDGYIRNIWEYSLLKENVNGSDYLNNSTYMDNNMRDMLVTTPSWNIGGATTNELTAKNFYDNEINNITTEGGTVAVIYPSDYGFAAPANYWSTTLNNYSGAVNDNWMNINSLAHTLTIYDPTTSNVFFITASGNLDYSSNVLGSRAVRPVVFLKSTVLYVDGNGTYTNMYTIS